MASDFNPQFQKIGEILIHAGKIDESQLNNALAEQKQTNEKIGQTLVSTGVIDEDDFITAYSMQMGCLLYTSPSPRDERLSRMPSSA